MSDIEAWMTVFKGLWTAIGSFIAATAAAFIGRLAWHTKQVQKKLRRFWSKHLPLELIVAVFMGYVGAGLAAYFDLPDSVKPGFIASLSYLGPPMLERWADRILAKLTK